MARKSGNNTTCYPPACSCPQARCRTLLSRFRGQAGRFGADNETTVKATTTRDGFWSVWSSTPSFARNIVGRGQGSLTARTAPFARARSKASHLVRQNYA